jgi:L-fuculose-phosphate aldolase
MNYTGEILEKKKADLLKVLKELDGKGFLSGSSGNVSIKIDDNSYLITPSGIPVFILKEDDFLVVDANGNKINNAGNSLKASSELPMHLLCYKKRPGVNAVIHSHAPNASAFAISGKGLDMCVMPEIIMVLGRIPLVPYTTPTTMELAEQVSDYIKNDYRALLLENHGVLVTGSDVFDACNNLTIVETYAETYLKAISIGNVNALSSSQVKELDELKKRLSFETTNITCSLNHQENPGGGKIETVDASINELVKIITENIIREISKKS